MDFFAFFISIFTTCFVKINFLINCNLINLLHQVYYYLFFYLFNSISYDYVEGDQGHVSFDGKLFQVDTSGFLLPLTVKAQHKLSSIHI